MIAYSSLAMIWCKQEHDDVSFEYASLTASFSLGVISLGEAERMVSFKNCTFSIWLMTFLGCVTNWKEIALR